MTVLTKATSPLKRRLIVTLSKSIEGLDVLPDQDYR